MQSIPNITVWSSRASPWKTVHPAPIIQRLPIELPCGILPEEVNKKNEKEKKIEDERDKNFKPFASITLKFPIEPSITNIVIWTNYFHFFLKKRKCEIIKLNLMQ